jgi:hypothetical protein
MVHTTEPRQPLQQSACSRISSNASYAKYTSRLCTGFTFYVLGFVGVL